MSRPLVTLAYRQLIDTTARTPFEEYVFEDTYQEFLVQAQTYNADRKLTTWQQIRAAFPEATQLLPPRVGFAIGQLMQALDGRIPGLWDTLELQNVVFTDYQFFLLSSDITDRTAHRVALVYRTKPMRLVQTIGNYLILAAELNDPANLQPTFTLEMRPNLSITTYLETE